MDIIVEMMKSAPQSAAVIVVVLILVRYFEKRDRLTRDYDADRENRHLKVTEELQKEHVYHREQSRISIERNTAIMERNVSATERNTFTLETLAKTMQEYIARQGVIDITRKIEDKHHH